MSHLEKNDTILLIQEKEKIAKDNGELELQSGKQELFENIVNQYI